MFVHFTIYNSKHNPPKNYKIYYGKLRFYIIMGFQNVDENEFHGSGNLVLWLWKSFRNIFKGVCTNPNNILFQESPTGQ